MSNTFQGGSTEGWQHGPLSGNPPFVVLNGGPNGAGDHALEISSTGLGGPGSRFVAFNADSGWTGDYLTAGVTAIELDVLNTGATDLHLRLAFDGPGGDFVTNSILVGIGTGWQSLQFAIQPSDLIGVGGGFSSTATLGSVNQFQIMSAMGLPGVGMGGLPRGDAITASARFDNITAVPEPNGFVFASLVLLSVGLAGKRKLSRSERRL